MVTRRLDLKRLNVFPLAERKSLTRLEDIIIPPDSDPAPVSEALGESIRQCARAIRDARERGAAVMLIYGAHLLRNGTVLMLERLLQRGFITHLATNGAGTIHDWEYAWLGRSTESVRENVATGTFGTWDETGRNIQLALMAGGLHEEGYGQALGRYIEEDGADVPTQEALKAAISAEPGHYLTAARADLLQAMMQTGFEGGRIQVEHPNKHGSILASAFRHGVPMTVHPGIGYDITTCHPLFSGSVIGRAAAQDFSIFSGSVEQLDGGVVLSIGSAIMGPQVFEKSISCVNNLRIQNNLPVVSGHQIYVVDMQDGGGWDWSTGEPPKSNPAYYLRFCKSYARMGGEMQYLQSDNAAFVHHLMKELI